MLAIRNIKNNIFFRNVIKLTTGTAISQLILMICSPILTRMYSPDDFGVLAIYISIGSIITVLATGRYEMSIILPQDERDATSLVLLCTISSFLTMILSFVITIYISPVIGEYPVSQFIYLVPLSVLFLSLTQTLMYWSNRKNKYKRIAVNKVINSIVMSCIQISCGLIFTLSYGLIIGLFVGQLISFILYLFYVYREDREKLKKISLRSVIENLRKYKKFPIYSMPTSVLDMFSNNMPLFILSSLFSYQIAGFYSLAVRMLSIPSSLLGMAVGQVFYPEFVKRLNENADYRSLLFSTWFRLALIGLLPMFVVLLYGGHLFGFLFGDSWVEAGKIASIISPMLYAMFISSPTSSTFIALNAQHINLFFGLAVFLMRPLTLYIGFINNSLIEGLYLLVIFEVIQIIIYNLVVLLKIKRISTVKIKGPYGGLND
ncbi:oligosaccharide flippase family protein [Cohnella cellulosilytica]|uniref:Oligosaccharide flippase family protein n=1 Tax=Cohnella cellulosilytica TaxID=986710 RepID=A0ABW2FAB9_9BACL